MAVAAGHAGPYAQRRRSVLSLVVTMLVFAQTCCAEDTLLEYQDFGKHQLETENYEEARLLSHHLQTQDYLDEEARLLSATPAPTYETPMPMP